jgi:hypothetical protein
VSIFFLALSIVTPIALQAHYVFRLGLEDLLAFMKTNPSTIKLHATFAPSLKELKSEADLRVK